MLLCAINLADAFMPFFFSRRKKHNSKGRKLSLVNYNHEIPLLETRNRFSKRKYRCRARQLDNNAYY